MDPKQNITVAKDIYGYIILTNIAIAFVCLGIFVLQRENRKEPGVRNMANVVLGICIASGGSLLMLMTIMFLKFK